MEDKEKQKARNQAYYQANRQELQARSRARRHTHPEQAKAIDRTHRAAHREERNVLHQVYYQMNQENLRAKGRAYYQNLKAEALRMLGGKCACPGCDESEPACLTVDHIHGRANQHRRAHRSTIEARDSGWDKTQFQILCANCNMAKSDRGFCPVHQKDPGQRNGHDPVRHAQLLLPFVESNL